MYTGYIKNNIGILLSNIFSHSTLVMLLCVVKDQRNGNTNSQFITKWIPTSCIRQRTGTWNRYDMKWWATIHYYHRTMITTFWITNYLNCGSLNILHFRFPQVRVHIIIIIIIIYLGYPLHRSVFQGGPVYTIQYNAIRYDTRYD